MLESIQITVEYTQMALLAILPYLSDFGDRLGINMPNPLTTNSVAIFRPSDFPANDVGGYVKLTNGFEFGFERGHVYCFSSNRSFYELQDPDRASEFYSDLHMNKQEAVAFARQAITNLGYST